MSPQLRTFEASDYEAALVLWQATPGVGLSDDDAKVPMLRFLARNEGLSFVAGTAEGLVGTILCGHDGRRGLIHHLVVAKEHRRIGLARALVTASLEGLRSQGISKAHLLVFQSNAEGTAYWRAVGAIERTELTLFSIGTRHAA